MSKNVDRPKWMKAPASDYVFKEISQVTFEELRALPVEISEETIRILMKRAKDGTLTVDQVLGLEAWNPLGETYYVDIAPEKIRHLADPNGDRILLSVCGEIVPPLPRSTIANRYKKGLKRSDIIKPKERFRNPTHICRNGSHPPDTEPMISPETESKTKRKLETIERPKKRLRLSISRQPEHNIIPSVNEAKVEHGERSVAEMGRQQRALEEQLDALKKKIEIREPIENEIYVKQIHTDIEEKHGNKLWAHWVVKLDNSKTHRELNGCYGLIEPKDTHGDVLFAPSFYAVNFSGKHYLVPESLLTVDHCAYFDSYECEWEAASHLEDEEVRYATEILKDQPEGFQDVLLIKTDVPSLLFPGRRNGSWQMSEMGRKFGYKTDFREKGLTTVVALRNLKREDLKQMGILKQYHQDLILSRIQRNGEFWANRFV